MPTFKRLSLSINDEAKCTFVGERNNSAGSEIEFLFITSCNPCFYIFNFMLGYKQ